MTALPDCVKNNILFLFTVKSKRNWPVFFDLPVNKIKCDGDSEVS